MIKIPPFLRPGDTIGITCPSGYMPLEKATSCVSKLKSWGFEVITGKTLGSDSSNYFSGSDEERCEELQSMLDNKHIKAVLFGRGGYGMSRIIDNISFRKFNKSPKWLIGFSDITVIQCHLISKYGIASMHAPMAAAFNDVEDDYYIQSLKNALTGVKNSYRCNAHYLNRQGKATAELVGGNLALLAHLTGSRSELKTKGRILFIEDIGEYIYNVDRMLIQMRRSGKFDKLAGLIVGGFSDMKDTDRPYGKSVEEVIRDCVETFDFPVCFNFPVSHTKENVALKIGASYRLDVYENETKLREI